MYAPDWVLRLAKLAASTDPMVYRNRRIAVKDGTGIRKALEELGVGRVSNVQSPHHYGRKQSNGQPLERPREP